MAMCKAMEDLQREAEDRAKAEIIISIMNNLNITVDQALIISSVPESDRDRVKTLVEEGLERGYV